MATGVNNPKSVPSGAAASASSSAAGGSAAAPASPSVFIPPADHSIGTWLSLGSYEEVFNSDWDYWEVNKALKNGGMKLVKILKIHNNLLKDRFDEELSLVSKGRNSGFNANVQCLYHGTSENLEKICHEGLDERLSTNGHFGRGIYFSDDPAFCRIQSEEKKFPTPFIVRCKVIVGDCKIYSPGSSDSALTREPIKTTDGGKNVFYDSVQGKVGNFRQFVVYEKRRALIQYVIYYTADGPIPTLPPIPAVASKSSRKKRPKSKERRQSTSSHDSDSRRHSSASSGDEKGNRRRGSVSPLDGNRKSGSVSSSDGHCSRKLSDVDNMADDDDGATCCRKTSVDESERNEAMSRPLTSDVPRVSTTRARTRRLMKTETESVPAVSAAPGATSAAVSLGATSPGTDTTTLSSAASGAGPASITSSDPNTDAYKKKVQENAMKQMLDLKGKLTTREMEELWHCFSQTYGGVNQPLNVQQHFSVGNEAAVPPGDDDIQLVTDVLVEQFQNFVGPVDPALARGYITQFGMDMERAVNAYFDSM